MTSRDPEMCCEPQSTFGGHVTSQCEAVRSAILATAWLLVFINLSFDNCNECEQVAICVISDVPSPVLY